MDRRQSSLLSNCSVTRLPVAQGGLASHHGRTAACLVKGPNRSAYTDTSLPDRLRANGGHQRRQMRLSSPRRASLVAVSFN